MSSKVLPPEDGPPVSSLAWRQVDTPLPGRAGAPRAEVPDYPALVEQTRKQAEQRIHEAHAQGVREGEAAGSARAAAQLSPVIERLTAAIEEVAGFRARLRREAEGDTIQLSLAIARRVLGRQIAIDPEALHGLILGALEKLEGQEISRVRIHPQQAALLTKCLEQRASGIKVEVVPDSSREPGVVVFETTHGNLDASIETQLQEIERGLADVLRRQR